MARTKWKTPTTLYLPIKVLMKVKQEAEKKQTSTSKIVSIILSKYYKEEKEETTNYKLITCKKCGAEYSSKFKSCPQCDKKEIKEKINKKEKEKQEKEKQKKKKIKEKIKQEKERLDKLIEYRKQGKATGNEVMRQRQKIKEMQEKK
ncbi:MAG: hypothetical protein ACOC5T_01995 [Elusimicrobiota bacterium]